MNYDDLAKKAKVLYPKSESMREQWVTKTANLYLEGKHRLSQSLPKLPTKEEVYEAYIKVKALTVANQLLTDADVHAIKSAGFSLYSVPDRTIHSVGGAQ